MKMKLKELRQKLAAAKTAWQEAKKSKKSADELKRLRGCYEKILAHVDGAESEGKKDEDEVEVPEADLKPEEAKSADPGVIEAEELGKLIAKTVSETITEKLKDLPGANSEGISEERLKTIVQDVLKTHEADKKRPDEAKVRTMVSEVMEEALKSIKQPSKMKHGTGDAKGGGRKADDDNDDSGFMIEVPHSLSKGNLPLHMKQLLNVLLKRPMNQDIAESMVERGQKLGDNMILACRTQGAKALTTTGTGTGAEWVPRDLATELLRRLYLESALAQMMLAREIDMPTDPFDMPLQTTRPKFYRNNVQNREARASTPGTGKFTLATQKCMALVQYSYEAKEDSIIPLLPMLQRLLGEAAAESLESMLINGDSAATHMDSDITDPDDVNKAWDGFRKLALASTALKVDFSTGGITRANLLSLKRALGKWGRRPNDLVWITGGLAENAFLGLDEVITADKRGSAGTTQTGTINSYWGIPIVVSEVMREDLNAAGVYDGTTTTKGSVLLVRLSDFVLGSRRDFMVEVDRNIKSQTNDIVASFRKAFKPVETPSATHKVLAIGYNFNS